MGSTDSFVHLHNHTEYSMLDGAAKIEELIKTAAEMGMPAIATTDHGNMFSAYEFYKTAKKYDIKPIIGTEAYLAPGTHRSDKTRVKWGNGGGDDVSGGGAYTHMTMVAETTEGMHNLFRLSSYASIEGQYFKPRMDRELLQQYAKGVIATTGCPSGEIQTRLRLGQYDLAIKAASEFQDIFGKENFFLEIMDHGISIERRVRDDLLKLGKDLGIPQLVTNDLHYTHKEDAVHQEALLCVQSGSTLNDPNRFKFDGEGYYLKSAEQMRHEFADFPEGLDNTLAIAERCSAEFDESANYMPVFPVPEGETEASWFRKEIERGLNYRYGDTIPDNVQERAEYELGIITQMGFPGYFLVVADYIKWAKENGIRVGPGRGSGAGSMIAYALRITDLDPIEHGLIFERFLNPDRVSMPDFDIDFDDRRRLEVVKYVTEKYGSERVAQIVTYGTIKSKQALKDASRVLGYPFSVGDQLTKAMPAAVMGKDIPLSGVYDPDHPRFKEANEMRAVIDSNPDFQKVFETARGIEGLKRQWGVHAAGVIMSSDPIIDVIPLMKREQDGQIVTQFDYPACESLGLIKMDFLGLRNLTILSDALENIESNRGETIDLERMTLDDAETYQLLSRGDTLGVFQLDGDGLRSLLRLMKPDSFNDVSATIALYRPGPMGANSHTNYAMRKNGQQPITPIHPELEEPLKEILGESYGLIIYQEQVMAIAQKVAGYTLGQADLLRRAMGKKKKSELDKQFGNFKSGMNANGFSDAAVKALWDILLPFSDYAFNKAHSAAYGVVSYWTGYLKCHYAPEYMSALLTSVGDSRDKLAEYLNECRHMGIAVLQPDVNESTLRFRAAGKDIRFGLGAVRNVGAQVVADIVEEREANGSFSSFHDFLKRCSLNVLNRRTIESLIKAGAFDSMGYSRRSLVEIHEDAIDAAVSRKRNEAHGQVDLFAGLMEFEEEESVVPERPEFTRRDKLAFERDMLGLYVSDHPLKGLEAELSKLGATPILSLLGDSSIKDGEQVQIAGLLTTVQHRIARNSGNPYAMVSIEDFGGEMTVMFLGKTYAEYSADLVSDTIAVIRGRAQHRDDGINITAQGITIPHLSVGEERPVTLTIADTIATEGLVERLDQLLRRNAGESEVRLNLQTATAIRKFELPHRVEAGSALYSELAALLGPGSVD
ncbi:DNA polymerase III subunit alpha [Gulosibacter molinativorax]|uniref:DNA polymerase III subunit alpha n=1 Tax=Gulosibacter molinativorax TaxID=256821 RepID=A0ABT7C5M9_9MICO|nr:DNA polymerase III subunit alpha [Gulosibacter molinativorax]MDJ1370408.1 DNA polymerase III subunit alpha [Gulosibacter molinativorax]QUY61321.1 DNA-directed DNA polymerase [Gulosibacter molinativorax]